AGSRPRAAAARVADDHVGGALDELPLPAAMLGGIVQPIGGLSINEDGLRALLRLPHVGPAAHRVDPDVVDAQRRPPVDEHRGRPRDRRPCARMRAARTPVSVRADIGLVSEATLSWHWPIEIVGVRGSKVVCSATKMTFFRPGGPTTCAAEGSCLFPVIDSRR